MSMKQTLHTFSIFENFDKGMSQKTGQSELKKYQNPVIFF